MKASVLLEKIREDLKDYPIDYLKNKANDERYPDSIVKRLAGYNSNAYDEIFNLEITEDFDINDNVIDSITGDLEYYFESYGPGDKESQDFTLNITLYLALICKKPLHPFSDDKKDEVYFSNGKYICKNRVKYIKDERSLCRYCVCRNAGFMDLF